MLFSRALHSLEPTNNQQDPNIIKIIHQLALGPRVREYIEAITLYMGSTLQTNQKS